MKKERFMPKFKIIVILGPTASGKSDIAVELARKFNGEVISADSRQVYKGLDIGTGKITKKEMKGVKHHLLDVEDPRKRFTASDFVKLTNGLIRQIVNSGKVPIICGGTGFYIDALLGDKQIPEVPPNPKLRKKLENKAVEELFEILKKLDPERAKNIDAKNPRRLVRAIEICKALGTVPKLQIPNPKNQIPNKFQIIKLGIAPISPPTPSYNKRGQTPKINEEELKKRINKRIEKWFKQGLIKEVENLHKKGLSWKRMSEIGLEYKLVAEHLKNYNTPKSTKGTLVPLKEKMQRETWQYAKRQMTWFKKTKDVVWLPPKVGSIEKETGKFLKS